jgi:signal transduction histidine kinase
MTPTALRRLVKGRAKVERMKFAKPRWNHPYRIWSGIRWISLALAAFKAVCLGSQLYFWSIWLLALVWTACLSLYPTYRARGANNYSDIAGDPFWRRPETPSRWQLRWLELERHYGLPVLEVATSILLTVLSGGIASPLFEWGQTSLIAPVLNYGVVGAVSTTMVYMVFYAGLLSIQHPQIPAAISLQIIVSPVATATVAFLLGQLISRAQREHILKEQNGRAAERQQLIQDLHDGSLQTQYALGLKLETLVDRLSRGQIPPPEKLHGLLQLSRQCQLETRRVMLDPKAVLDPDVSVVDLVGQLLSDFGKVSHMEIDYQSSPVGDLTAEARVQLYRFLQECLANIYKHSGANKVTVELGPGRLSVVDDGRGCDLSSLKPGRGWRGLQERANSLKANLTRTSTPNQGTQIRLEWNHDLNLDR